MHFEWSGRDFRNPHTPGDARLPVTGDATWYTGSTSTRAHRIRVKQGSKFYLRGKRNRGTIVFGPVRLYQDWTAGWTNAARSGWRRRHSASNGVRLRAGQRLVQSPAAVLKPVPQ